MALHEDNMAAVIVEVENLPSIDLPFNLPTPQHCTRGMGISVAYFGEK